VLSVVVVLTAHLIGDFVCQSDWMAVHKSKRWDALTWHVGVYTVVIAGIVTVAFNHHWITVPLSREPVAWWIGANAAAHFVTDAVTSRITSRLWFLEPAHGIWVQAENTVPKHGRTLVNPWVAKAGGNRHWFFVTIGIDQWIHAVTLLVTAGWWLGGGR
jgi:hypothetical protein